MANHPLNAEVKRRYSTEKLVQLTNQTGASTSINDSVLNAACEDAEGTFLRVAGVAMNTLNKVHVSILMQGVIQFLESYKIRDGAIFNLNNTAFYSACERFRKLHWIPAEVPNEHDFEEPTRPTMLDSDTRQPIYQKPVYRLKEYNED